MSNRLWARYRAALEKLVDVIDTIYENEADFNTRDEMYQDVYGLWQRLAGD